MPFLSLLDERARPKGSRDPLGFELVWTHFGRQVVGNLTTITGSWRNFATALLGFHLSNELCRGVEPSQKQKKLQEHFIRYEQIAGYLKVIATEDPHIGREVMGITRIRKRLSDSKKTISISAQRQDQILSNQISYGLWGLYSTAMRETGLIKGDHRELSAQGHHLLSLLGESETLEWLKTMTSKENQSLPISQLTTHSKKFTNLLSNRNLKTELMKALLSGNNTEHKQWNLYEVTRKLDDDCFPIESVSSYIDAIKKQPKCSQELKKLLIGITQLNPLLVAANTLFDYCRRQDGKQISEVADLVSKQYDFSFIDPSLSLTTCPYGTELETLRSQLQSNSIKPALETLISLNKTVMNGRGGASWIDIESTGHLKVRMKAETAELISQAALQSRWDYDYFLRSYSKISAKERELINNGQ